MELSSLVALHNISALVLYLTQGDSDEKQKFTPRGGSRFERARKKDWESVRLDAFFYRQCFSINPVYNNSTFCHRLRVSKQIFDKSFFAVVAHDYYFTQRRDCRDLLGYTTSQKTTVTMRLFAYGVASDVMDEKLGMAVSTVQEKMLRF